MTDRDDQRMRKALQGMDFPASRNEVVAYASERSEDDATTLEALTALPEGTYPNLDAVVDAVPQRPDQTESS